MTADQRVVIATLINALATITKPEQIDFIWSTLEAACRQAGISIGNKPTSIGQAKSIAPSLKNRLLGN